MFINKKQQLVIIGHINDSTIINNLTNNGFFQHVFNFDFGMFENVDGIDPVNQR